MLVEIKLAVVRPALSGHNRKIESAVIKDIHFDKMSRKISRATFDKLFPPVYRHCSCDPSEKKLINVPVSYHLRIESLPNNDPYAMYSPDLNPTCSSCGRVVRLISEEDITEWIGMAK